MTAVEPQAVGLGRAAEFLLSRDNFLILTHIAPDGDTIGCAAALCAGLRRLGKAAFVAPNPDITPRYLPFVLPYLPDGATTRSDTVVAVDTAKVVLMPGCFWGLSVDLKIDHHPDGESFAGLNLVHPNAAACGEVIYALLCQGLGLPLTLDMATPLYLAIVTDTGCFRYSNTSAATLRLAAELMDVGVDPFPINEEIFGRKSRSRFSVEAMVLSGMEYLYGGKVALGTLSGDMIKAAGATEDDLESISALPRQIAGVEVGFMLRQESESCKISVRTVEPYLANAICGELGGGGHARASGCRFRGTLAEAREAVLLAWDKLYGQS